MPLEPYYEHAGITIYHGDCREVEAWLAASVMVADVTYGIGYSSSHSGKFKGSKLANDDDTLLRDDALALWGDKPALVFGSWKMPRPEGVRHLLIWEKGEHVGMGDLSMPWRPNIEEIYVLGRGFQGKRTTSVLRHNAVSPNFTPAHLRYHPTEKPLSLMAELISKCPTGLVADPFMGSGTTLLAAKNLGRQAVGVELDEKYCEIAAKRLCQDSLFGETVASLSLKEDVTGGR